MPESSFYDVTLADLILGGIGIVLTAIGIVVAKKQNTLAHRANELAEKALKVAEEQGRVALRIEPSIKRERSVDQQGKLIKEIAWLELKVVNDGVEAELAKVGLRQPGWTGQLSPIGCRLPYRMKSKEAVPFIFSWEKIKKNSTNAAELYSTANRAIAETSCGVKVELEHPVIQEWIALIKKDIADSGSPTAGSKG